MRIRLALAMLLAAACAHTKGISPDEQSAAGGQAVEKKASETPGQPPLASAPQSVLKPGSVRKIQAALAGKGFEIKEDGELGTKTQQQLQSFQKQQHLPETGLPDQETLRRLGLNPDDLYRSNPK